MLQLAIVFMCGVGQLSPGAYLLQRDLFPSIVLVSTPGEDFVGYELIDLLF